MKTASSTTSLIAVAVIAGAFAAGFATGPAFAQAPEAKADPFKFEFTFAPSELSTAPSAQKLLARLEQDVRRHCSVGGRLSIEQHQKVDACIDATMRETVSKFSGSTVAEAYQSRGG